MAINRYQPAVLLLALVGAAAAPPAGLGQTPARPKLAEELEDDLLKDLPKNVPPAKGDKAGSFSKRERDNNLLRDLKEGEDIGSPPENPLARIGERMRAAQELIAERDTSEKTQATQKEILSELARLIEQTKKRCSGSAGKPAQGKSSAQAGAGTGEARPGPARESTDRVGKANFQDSETTDVKDVLRRIWGHLPDKMRDQMQAQLSEQFLPKYENLIEEYYKRLAEERP